MDDLISRQAAIDALCNDFCDGHQDCKYYPKCGNLKLIQELPTAQPEPITVNIDHEFTQEEYKKLCEDMANAPIMLLPTAQTEIIRCKDCKYCDRGIDEDGNPFLKCLGWVYGGTQEEDFCSHAERRTDERVVMEMDGGV